MKSKKIGHTRVSEDETEHGQIQRGWGDRGRGGGGGGNRGSGPP